MFRLRSKSGDESVFRSPEEIRSALLSGFVTPDAQIWDADLKGWVPLLEHALYQQISATPPGRKSGAVKAPPSAATPAGPKPVQKLVIKRPGEGATTAIPAVKPPAAAVPPVQPPQAPTPPVQPPKATPPTPPKAADDFPDLELIDLDLTPEMEEAPASPPPAPKPAPPAPTPPPAEKPAAPAPPPPSPKRPTPAPPAPAPEPVAVPRASTARLSTPRMPDPVVDEEEEEAVAAGGSKKGIVIGAIVLLVAAGVGFAVLRGKKGSPAATDTSAVTAPAAPVIDSTRHDSAAVDSTKRDSTVTPAVVTVAPVDTAKQAPAASTVPPKPDTSAHATGGAIAPVPFAPTVARGSTPWNARPVVGAPLSIPALEAVRLRYLAAQSRALEQYESGLEATGFADLFDPAKVSNADRRSEAFDAIDAGRSALRDFRRRQAAIDFAYTDSMRQAMPPGSDTPDFRTFGPILRESPAQAALTDSLVGAVAEMYGMLTTEVGGYTFRGGMLVWKDADNAARYQTLEEQLTAQLARIRNRAPSEVPPAMAATLRGIGLPR